MNLNKFGNLEANRIERLEFCIIRDTVKNICDLSCAFSGAGRIHPQRNQIRIRGDYLAKIFPLPKCEELFGNCQTILDQNIMFKITLSRAHWPPTWKEHHKGDIIRLVISRPRHTILFKLGHILAGIRSVRQKRFSGKTSGMPAVIFNIPSGRSDEYDVSREASSTALGEYVDEPWVSLQNFESTGVFVLETKSVQ
jgi:hypothetical protein